MPWCLLGNQLTNHLLSGTMIICMLIMGFMFHFQPKNDAILPMERCHDMTLNYTHCPLGLKGLTLSLGLLMPVIPISMRTRLEWHPDRDLGLVSHLLGQTTAFGISELVRFYHFYPAPYFLDRCNITLEECLMVGCQPLNVSLFCPQPKMTFPHLQDLLHYNPDTLSAMLGAACVSFIFGTFFYMGNRVKWEGNGFGGSYIFLGGLALFGITMTYFLCAYQLYQVTFLSFLWGALVQLVVASFTYTGIAMTEPTTIEEKVRTPTAVKKMKPVHS